MKDFIKKNRKQILIISPLIIAVAIFIIYSSQNSIFNPKWNEAKNKVNQYLENKYGDKFWYEKPKKTIDTDGSGRTDESPYIYNHEYYVKTFSKKYPKMGKFVNYYTNYDTNDDTYEFIKECYQSVKFAYLLECDLDKLINIKHHINVDGLKWETASYSKVYDTYEDYYNSGTNNETKIWLYIYENDINSNLKKMLENMITHTPEYMSGKLIVQAINDDLRKIFYKSSY